MGRFLGAYFSTLEGFSKDGFSYFYDCEVFNEKLP
jgi:hypothetical protein